MELILNQFRRCSKVRVFFGKERIYKDPCTFLPLVVNAYIIYAISALESVCLSSVTNIKRTDAKGFMTQGAQERLLPLRN